MATTTERITALEKRLAGSGVGTKYHGDNASTARPKGWKRVIWTGSVEPSNAAEHDIWCQRK